MLGSLLSRSLLCHPCSPLRATLSGWCCFWAVSAASTHKPCCRDSSCLFCVLTLLHDPATCLLVVSAKGWRAAESALGGESLAPADTVQGSPHLALTAVLTHSILPANTSAGILLPYPDVPYSRKLLRYFNHSLLPFAWQD